MDIPNHLLDSLKCSNCDGYLSCGPIYTIEFRKALCGKCSSTGPNSRLSEVGDSDDIKKAAFKQRDYLYEILASLFQFPCRFAVFGCPEKIHFSEEPSHFHELSCTYEPNVCPMLPDNLCNWRGPWNALLEHCEQAHSDSILENPFSTEPNFAEDSIGTFVISCFDTLFLLRVTVSLRSKRIMYTMFLLDDPSKALLYHFSVECKRNYLTFLKTGNVATTEILMQQKSIPCIVNHDMLLTKVGAIAGTSFTVTIKQQNTIIKCKFCPIESKLFKGNEWLCKMCERKLEYCKFKTLKCTFKDVNSQKVKKHEQYFCKHITKCFDCFGEITLGKVLQHFEQCDAHENTIATKPGIVWNANATAKRTCNYVLFTSKVIGKLFGKYYLDERQFSLILFSMHSSDQCKLYTCTIEVSEKETKFYKIFTPDVASDYIWDWRIDIDFDDIIRYEQINLKININFDKNISLT